MMNVALQMIVYCVILVVLAIPLGSYMGKVMNGERVFLSRLLLPVENLIYRVLRIDKEEEMDWKKYSVCTAVFSVLSLFVLWAILCFQKFLPLNLEEIFRVHSRIQRDEPGGALGHPVLSKPAPP